MKLSESIGLDVQFDTNEVSKADFLAMAKDPVRTRIGKQQLNEAKTAIQGWLEGHCQRPRCPKS